MWAILETNWDCAFCFLFSKSFHASFLVLGCRNFCFSSSCFRAFCVFVSLLLIAHDLLGRPVLFSNFVFLLHNRYMFYKSPGFCWSLCMWLASFWARFLILSCFCDAIHAAYDAMDGIAFANWRVFTFRSLRLRLGFSHALVRALERTGGWKILICKFTKKHVYKARTRITQVANTKNTLNKTIKLFSYAQITKLSQRTQ